MVVEGRHGERLATARATRGTACFCCPRADLHHGQAQLERRWHLDDASGRGSSLALICQRVAGSLITAPATAPAARIPAPGQLPFLHPNPEAPSTRSPASPRRTAGDPDGLHTAALPPSSRAGSRPTPGVQRRASAGWQPDSTGTPAAPAASTLHPGSNHGRGDGAMGKSKGRWLAGMPMEARLREGQPRVVDRRLGLAAWKLATRAPVRVLLCHCLVRPFYRSSPRPARPLLAPLPPSSQPLAFRVPSRGVPATQTAPNIQSAYHGHSRTGCAQKRRARGGRVEVVPAPSNHVDRHPPSQYTPKRLRCRQGDTRCHWRGPRIRKRFFHSSSLQISQLLPFFPSRPPPATRHVSARWRGGCIPLHARRTGRQAGHNIATLGQRTGSRSRSPIVSRSVAMYYVSTWGTSYGFSWSLERSRVRRNYVPSLVRLLSRKPLYGPG